MFLAYFLVAELILVIGRFTYNLVILPKHLTLFPASKSTLFYTTVIADIGDIKSVVYFVPVFIYVSNFIFEDLLLFVYALFLFVMFFLLLEVFLILIYLPFVKYFQRYKNSLSIIYSILILILVLLGSNNLGFIAQLPVIGWVGAGVDALAQGMGLAAARYAGALLGVVGLELLLGYVLIQKTRLMY